MDGWTRDDSKYCASIASRDKNLLTERVIATNQNNVHKKSNQLCLCSLQQTLGLYTVYTHSTCGTENKWHL